MNQSIENLLKQKYITPDDCSYSWKKLYLLLTAAESAGISKGEILEKFNKFSNVTFLFSAKLSYIYLVHKMYPDYIGLTRYAYMFLLYDFKRNRVYKENPELYVQHAREILDYPIESLFPLIDEKAQDEIRMTKLEKKIYGDKFIINPYELPGYFTYRAPMCDVWNSRQLYDLSLEIGEPALVPYELAVDRFNQLSYGLFDKPQNHEVDFDFPWDSVVFAGGFITKILMPYYNSIIMKNSDIDIFIIGNEKERRITYNKLIDWFSSDRTYFALTGCVTTIYIERIKRKIQIITESRNISVYSVLNGFDLTYVQWAYHRGKFHGMPHACESLRTLTTRFHNKKKLRDVRLIKALCNGYSIAVPHRLEPSGFEPLMSNLQGEQAQNIIGNLYSGFIPKRDKTLLEKDQITSILYQVKNDSRADFVTRDPVRIKENVNINGNIAEYSGSNLRSDVKPSDIYVRHVHKSIITLSGKYGRILFGTELLRVAAVDNTADSIDIVVHADEKLIKLVATLQGEIYRMFTENTECKNMLRNGTVVFKVPKSTIMIKKSLCRNKFGKLLNIEETAPDDIVKIVFVVKFDRERDLMYFSVCSIMNHSEHNNIYAPLNTDIPNNKPATGSIQYKE